MARRPDPVEFGDRAYRKLFVLSGKGATEDDYREAFAEYGTLEDVQILRDRNTGEEKGLCYLTFNKVSEAALAMEEMRGRTMKHSRRPMKIVVASDKNHGSGKEPNEDEKMLRLFIMIPRSHTDKDVEKVFKEYGDVRDVHILKHRDSGESKGVAYVTFFRAYHAALAFEKCESQYKPKFAEPRLSPQERDMLQRRRGDARRDRDPYGSRNDDRDRYGGSSRRSDMSDSRSIAALGSLGSLFSQQTTTSIKGPHEMSLYPHEGYTRLRVGTSSFLNEDQLRRLFDLFPGFEYCDLDWQNGVAYVKFLSPQGAAYAKKKLADFEYPLGYRLQVEYVESDPRSRGSEGNGNEVRDAQQNIQSLMQEPNAGGNIAALLETIKKASAVIERFGESSLPRVATKVDCSVQLPEKQPLAASGAAVAERVFIVVQHGLISDSALQDVFCRFGNLIEVFLVSGKNFGYAKFGTTESAQKAIQILHLQEINGQRIKVIKADPPKTYDDPPYKRQRTDDN